MSQSEAVFSLGEIPRTRSPTLAAVLMLGLLPLAVFVLSGFSSLLGRPVFFHGDPWDLHWRWIEEQCVREGKSPIDVKEGRLPPPAAGTPTEADYPPWALVMALLFTRPDWRATCQLFALYNLAALAGLAIWAYGIGAARSIAAGILLALAVLAIGVNRTVLNIGQYPIIICGLLVLSYVLETKGRYWLAGIALGLSLLKFNISLPFCLCFLMKGRWKTLVAAGTMVVIASLISWKLIHVPPWTSFREASAIGVTVVTRTPTLPKALISAGFPPNMAVLVCAVSVGSIGALLMWLYRQSSMLLLFAIASVTARLWTFHYYYDDVMLLFPLVALGYYAIAAQPSKHTQLHIIAWLAVGLTLWLTMGIAQRWYIVLVQYLTWLFGLYSLILPLGEQYAMRLRNALLQTNTESPPLAGQY